MSDSSDPRKPPEDMTVGELFFEVSDRAVLLVREEVELAKTEVTEKVGALARGSIGGVVAAVFAVFALAMFMHAFAWLLNDLFFSDHVWIGFGIEALLFLAIAAAAGLYAWRSVKKGAPPTPDMAISEAKEIRSSFEAPKDGATPPPAAPATPAPAVETPAEVATGADVLTETPPESKEETT